MSGSNFLYPNVTSLPGQTGVGQTERTKPAEGAPGEFGKALDSALSPASAPLGPEGLSGGLGLSKDLNQLREPLKFSSHASQRLKERNIKMDSAMMAKVSDAVDKADAKGIEESLVLTPDAALIVSVKNRTVITAMDRGSMSGNVFTNIDGAVIV